MKFAISNQLLATAFIHAHFVGNNHEAAVSNLFAKEYMSSKPCFYYSSHSFAKKSSSLADLLIAQFHISC